MTWDPPTDLELAADEPGTTGKFIRLRDMVESAFAGDAGAPVLNRKSIGAGSSGADLVWIDSTSVSGLGFFEPEAITLSTVGLTLPPVTIARVNGDVTIGAGLTLRVDTITAAERLQAQLLGCLLGNNGTSAAGANATGGGSVGAGGDIFGGGGTVSGTAQPVSGTRWFWNKFRPFVGGLGGVDSLTADAVQEAGGCLILIIDGNLTMGAGAKITANAARSTTGGVDVSSAGSGGGTIIVICTGTITGGTFEAKGSDGDNHVNASHGGYSGAGGGGYIALVASAFAGSQTTSVIKGAVNNGGSVSPGATDGTVDTVTTLSEEEIRAILIRSF